MLHYILLPFIFLHAPFCLSATIIEAKTIQEVEDIFECLTPQSLLIWDIDHTLIYPKDKILGYRNEPLAFELSLRYLNRSNNQKWTDLITSILTQCSYQLVNPHLVNLISLLQTKQIPTMAFTALRTGCFGKIESMETWREKQLNTLGIDFTSFLSKCRSQRWEGTTFQTYKPRFQNGILYSDRLDKGVVFEQFFPEINSQPDVVVFVDDTLQCLKSVAGVLEKLNIPFIGIHYLECSGISLKANPEIANFQYQTLADKEIWLSDEEAEKGCLIHD